MTSQPYNRTNLLDRPCQSTFESNERLCRFRIPPDRTSSLYLYTTLRLFAQSLPIQLNLALLNDLPPQILLDLKNFC